MQQKEPSATWLTELAALRQEVATLRGENADLKRENAELARDNADLELLMEMSEEHSDRIEAVLYDKTQAALRESERRLRLIVEAMPVPVFIARSNDGAIVYANAMAAPLVGLPTEALLERNVLDFYHDPMAPQQLLERLSKQEQVNNVEVQIKKADGTILWVALSLRQLMFNDEPSWLSALHDITERKQTEQLLAEYNRTLEEQVKQRTAQLAQAIQQAEEARAAAEEANETKSAFLANVSHELRTPLTSVLGFAKIVQKRVNSRIFPHMQNPDRKTKRAMKQISQNLEIVVSEGERLTTLINNVLDLAKIEAGKVEWKMQPLAIAKVIEQALAATSTLFAQKGIQPLKEVPDALPDVIGDRDRLIQVVINLLSNAIKFTDEGAVTCRVQQTDHDLIIRVIDTGMGIAKADQPKVFEKFKQVGDTLTDKPKGTGLGLPICKEIISHHQGRIWVESELGQGSTFSFTLPIGHPDMSHAPTNALPLPDESTQMALDTWMKQLKPTSIPADRPRQPTILVVDDEAHIRQLLHQLFEAEGYLVHEAANGIEAIAQAKILSPDLIMLDILMPGLNGFDVAAVLKQDPQTVHTPIIILSIIEDKERGYRLGVDRYFTKPVDTEALLSEIERLLRPGRANKKAYVVDENNTTIKILTDAMTFRET